MNRPSLVALVIGALASAACSASTDSSSDSAPQAWDAESTNDETTSTHLWVVDHGMAILAKHPEVPGSANNLAWLNDERCKSAWQTGLLEADFLAPFNAGADDLKVPDGSKVGAVESAEDSMDVLASHSSWMSHFYDPDTGLDYKGFAMSSDLPDDTREHPFYSKIRAQLEVNGPVPLEARGSSLYRLERARKLLAGQDEPASHPNEPSDTRARGCYELGLALHYFTDITQPQHAANFSAADSPRLLHSNWEGYAEKIQSGYVLDDWSEPASGALEDEILRTAQLSKARWTATDGSPGPLQKAILDAYRGRGTWDKNGNRHYEPLCGVASDDLRTTGSVKIDVAKCWQGNITVTKETGEALRSAQERTARFLALLALPQYEPSEGQEYYGPQP